MKDSFNNLSPTIKIVLVIIAIVIVYFLTKTAKSYFQRTVEKAEDAGEIIALNQQGVVRSYSDSQYKAYADRLETSMKGWGTSIQEVYAVYGKMKNDVDMIHLNNKFGVRDGYNLRGWLLDDLATFEIEAVNHILKQKGITRLY